MMKQRVCGVILLILSLLLVLMAAGGETVEERDITVTIFLVPLGFYMIFTKQRIMYDFSKTGVDPPAPRRSARGDDREATTYVEHR